jgi:hypothetical protein
MATSPKGTAAFLRSFPVAAAARENLSKNFAGLRRTFPALQRKPEKEQPASKRVGKKPGVEPFVFARVLEQMRRSERGKKPQHTLFMNEAVTLHRDIAAHSERLKALKADLIREAQRHKEDFTITVAGESLDELFDSRHYLKPVADFRDEVAAALPRRAAAQLIELCQVKCSPRVSFETAETKTKER